MQIWGSDIADIFWLLIEKIIDFAIMNLIYNGL